LLGEVDAKRCDEAKFYKKHRKSFLIFEMTMKIETKNKKGLSFIPKNDMLPRISSQSSDRQQ
jgi:hypothetical protein